MNSLDRAKHFIAQKASRLALAAIPLAALAVSALPARATIIVGATFNPSTSCVVTGSGSGTCEIYQNSAIGGDSSGNWVALAGSGSQFNRSGGSLDFSASGSASGILPAGTLPVAWDFSINPLDVCVSESKASAQTLCALALDSLDVNWNVSYQLLLNSGSLSFSQSGSGAIGSLVKGSGAITIPTGEDVVGYSIDLDTNADFSYGINIPGNASIDLNPQLTSVPEPSTLLLVPGAAALLFLRRKKRG